MAKAVFTTKVDPTYDDLPEIRYHFLRSYLRPADAIGAAIMVAKIATGEIDDPVEDDGKYPNAKALGKKGGKARAPNLPPEQRSVITRKAAAKRWNRDGGP